MAKIDFKIPAKFSHNFEDEKKEELRCREIHKEFKTNAHLRYLATLYEGTIEGIKANGDGKLGIPEETFDLLDQNWEAILTYYALMDNPKSPFQIFKADYSEKSLCASQTLSLSNEVISLIDYIKPHKTGAELTPTQRYVVRNVFLQVRCKYNSIVSPYEWQNILDLQLYIYQTRLIVLSETVIDADKVARVQSEKASLRKDLTAAQLELRDLMGKYFGEDSPIRDKVEQSTRVMTVFEEFTIKKEDFINKGQGNKWTQ